MNNSWTSFPAITKKDFSRVIPEILFELTLAVRSLRDDINIGSSELHNLRTANELHHKFASWLREGCSRDSKDFIGFVKAVVDDESIATEFRYAVAKGIGAC